MAGVVTLVAIGAAAWTATIVTTGLARAGELTTLLAGIEALLLLVFASALQNLFVALMGLRGSAGDLLRSRSPVAWAAALGGVGFLFFHTLLNPQGDPAAALANRNVQVIFGLVGVFTVVTFATWGLLRLGATRPARPAGTPIPAGERQTSTAAGTPIGPVAPPTRPVTPSAPLTTDGPSTAASGPGAGWVPAGGMPASVMHAGPAGRPFEASIGTADGSARGRATFRLADGWIVARTQLVDPGARRQLRAFSVLSAAAWLVPFTAFAVAVEGPVTDAFVAGFLAVALAWLAVVVIARLLLERYAVAHTAVFPAGAIAATGGVGRDWNLGCALTILLTPLIGLLYLLLGGGRVIRVVAPLRADRPDPVAIRLKGSEAEARFLEQLLLAARLSG